MQELREACATVAGRARHVHLNAAAISAYAADLPLARSPQPTAAVGDEPGQPGAGPDPQLRSREDRAAFWLTLDAINFGSGWFPTLTKRPGHSGYDTVAAGIRDRFQRHGPWSAQELGEIRANEIAATLGQRPDHELMALFAHSLNDLGTHIARDFDGRFAAVPDGAGGSAVRLARTLGGWPSFADTSRYDGVTLPFLKRAQLAAADLARAGVASFGDLDGLTMFADNLVPHVLRLDGILEFDADLTARIEAVKLIEHGSPEEVEIRACAVHAVELIVPARPSATAARVDEILWNRGREPRYKASPRHRSRCTAY
jgi:hypothetical protein